LIRKSTPFRGRGGRKSTPFRGHFNKKRCRFSYLFEFGVISTFWRLSYQK